MRTLLREIRLLWENQYALVSLKELRGDLQKEDYIEIENARCKSNTQRVILFSFALLAIQMTDFFLYFLTDCHVCYKMEYCWASIYLSVLCIIFLIFIRDYALKEDTHNRKIVYRSFWGLYVLGSWIFCYFEILEGTAFTNYALLMMAISVIPVLNSGEMLVYAGFSFLVELVFLVMAGAITAEYIQLCIMILAIVFIISHLLYTSFFTVNMTHRKLNKMAETDFLTGLLNRRGFEIKLGCLWRQSVQNKSNVMVSMIDIDFFKSLNDEFGHDVGDESLKKIAENITLDFKRVTDIVARFGGEEFVIFATGLTDEKIIEFMFAIAERIEALKIAAGDTSVSKYVTVSIGAVSAVADTALSFDQLYTRVDKELSNAKNNGKNILSFNGIIYSSRPNWGL